MAIVTILLVIIFSMVLCFLEIPKMLKEGQYRELWAFSILLGLGTILAITKSLDVSIPNPSDLIAWVYSPFTEVMEKLMK